jgi:hypothetical protein
MDGWWCAACLLLLLRAPALLLVPPITPGAPPADTACCSVGLWLWLWLLRKALPDSCCCCRPLSGCGGRLRSFSSELRGEPPASCCGGGNKRSGGDCALCAVLPPAEDRGQSRAGYQGAG